MIKCDKCGHRMIYLRTTFVETEVYSCTYCGRKAEVPMMGGKPHYYGITNNEK